MQTQATILEVREELSDCLGDAKTVYLALFGLTQESDLGKDVEAVQSALRRLIYDRLEPALNRLGDVTKPRTTEEAEIIRFKKDMAEDAQERRSFGRFGKTVARSFE